MENNNQTNGFNFTYSAKEQSEIRHIREKYQPREEDKMQRLRRLDKSATNAATAWALVAGICGALIMGIGMSLAMTDLGAAMGLSHQLSMVIGVLVGLVGIAPAAFAYPIYNAVLKKQREKIADEVIRLTDELMK